MSRKATSAAFTLLFLFLAVSALRPGGAAAAEGAPAVGEFVEHKVRTGDNLMLLAGYYYKDPRQWRRIYAANRSTISNPLTIYPGTRLRIKADPDRQWNTSYSDYLGRVFN